MLVHLQYLHAIPVAHFDRQFYLCCEACLACLVCEIIAANGQEVLKNSTSAIWTAKANLSKQT